MKATARISHRPISGQDFSSLNLRGIKMDRAAQGRRFTGAICGRESDRRAGGALRPGGSIRRPSSAEPVSASLEDACLAKADMGSP